MSRARNPRKFLKMNPKRQRHTMINLLSTTNCTYHGPCHQPLQGLNQGHCSYRPATPLQRVQGGGQTGGALCSGKAGRTGLHIVRYFQEPNSCISSYPEKHYIPSWWYLLLVTRRNLFCKKYMLDYKNSLFTKITYILTFHLPLWSSFSELSEMLSPGV